MARFAKKRRRSTDILFRSVAALVLALLFTFGVRLIAKGDADRQEENLRQALEHDITACYAVEGRYPASLEYLRENYGLLYNEQLFYVDYQVTGSNVRPVVTVIRKK